MAYSNSRGRRPFERASKIGHTQIINNDQVREFISNCVLPEAAPTESLTSLAEEIPEGTGKVSTVVAIDGGLTETFVREEFPSASIAFMSFGPLLFKLSDLDRLNSMPFLGPEDMKPLRNVQRYNLVVPTRTIRAGGVSTFSQGVRRAVHDFLASGDGHLLEAFRWLVHRGWRANTDQEPWRIPRCPNPSCTEVDFLFSPGDEEVKTCGACGEAVYVTDGLRLYERIDEETGAGGILSYLLTTLEQLVLVHLVRSILDMKRSLLSEILFVKDGPLAFFGVTAPLYRPMRELVDHLRDSGEQLHLVGVEKSGPFVEHAALIEKRIPHKSAIVLSNEYIYRYIVPGDSASKTFGSNTYYGTKLIVRGENQEVYVATIPAKGGSKFPRLADLDNGAEVLRVLQQLRCSMYDNSLVPVVLANRLVSLADVPSAEILKKFARDRIG